VALFYGVFEGGMEGGLQVGPDELRPDFRDDAVPVPLQHPDSPGGLTNASTCFRIADDAVGANFAGAVASQIGG
jgi:hypothetical protein